MENVLLLFVAITGNPEIHPSEFEAIRIEYAETPDLAPIPDPAPALAPVIDPTPTVMSGFTAPIVYPAPVYVRTLPPGYVYPTAAVYPAVSVVPAGVVRPLPQFLPRPIIPRRVFRGAPVGSPVICIGGT